MAKKNKRKERTPRPESERKIEKTETGSVPIPQQEERKPFRDNSPIFSIGARLIFFLFLYWFWALRLYDFLYMVQYHDLFLWNGLYWKEYSSRIAGPLFYLTSFGIQFFYYPLLGGFLIALALSFLEILIARFYRFRSWNVLLSFIPPLLISVAITQINYYIFNAFNMGFLFAIIPGCLFVFLFGGLYRRMVSPNKRFLLYLAVIVVFYPLTGFYTLFAALLALLFDVACADDDRKYLRLEISFLVFLITPLFWGFFYKNQNAFSTLFYIGIVEENVIDKDEATRVFFYLSFWSTFVFLFLTSLSVMFYRLRKRENKENVIVCRSDFKCHYRELLLFFCFGLFLFGTVRYSFFPNNFRALLKTARLLDERRWNEIIEEEKTVPNYPVNPLISARFLALVKTGVLGDRLFERPQDPKQSIQLATQTSQKMIGDRILYEHGAVNLATRCAMNNFVDQNGHTVWSIKTLALCAMTSGDDIVARRYLNLLDNTMFYKNWSRQYRSWLDTSNKCNMEDSLRAIDEQIREIREKIGRNDYFSKAKAIDYSIMEHYYNYDFDNSSRDRMITILMIRLLVTDLDSFMEKVKVFLIKNGSQPIPRYIQEAILFDSCFIKKKEIDQTQWQFSPEILERFNTFRSVLKEIGPKPTPQQLSLLDRDYSDTVWYHLSFARKIEIY